MPVFKIKKNGIWEEISGISEHTHIKKDITDFPTSLPADGGNADTLGGKSADEFAIATDIEELRELIENIPIIEVDTTLSQKDKAADAKAVGDEIDGLKELIGDSSVAEQIATAIVDEVYAQADEPMNVPNGTLWVDLDEDANDLFIDIQIDTTLSIDGAAADAAAVGDALKLKQPIGNYIKTINGNIPNENGNIIIETETPPLFVITTYTPNDTTIVTADKTFEEINQAYLSGTAIYVKLKESTELGNNALILYPTNYEEDVIEFSNIVNNEQVYNVSFTATGDIRVDVRELSSGSDEVSIVVDNELNADSTNPVQNKAITQKFISLENDISDVAVNIPTLDSTLSNAGKAADAKAVGDALAEKQPIGNYVKTINGNAPDENGNVEIVGGEGSSGVTVQSDWNVTDETNAAYIKNKPFGETPNGVKQLNNKYLSIMETTAKDVLPEGNAEFYWDSAEGIWRNNTYIVSDSNWKNLVALYEAGQKLDVEIGGETYSVDITAGVMNDDGSYSGFMIGDITHTNYPFWIAISAGESSNRTLIPKQDVTLGFEQFGYPVGIGYPEEFGAEPFAVNIGETYEVTWNNSVHTCVAQDGNLIEEGLVVLGNGAAIGIDGLIGNNEPFILGFGLDNAIMIMSVADTEVGGTYSFGLSLPSTYTCDIWLKEDMGEPGEANIFPEQNVVIDSFDETYGEYVKTVIPPSFELELGAIYRVVWGEESFTVTTIDTGLIIPNSMAMGNGTDFGFPGNNEPFIIMYCSGFSTESSTDVPFLTFVSLSGVPDTYKVTIYKKVNPTLSIHAYTDKKDQIKKEYLPTDIGSGSDITCTLPEVSVEDAGKFLRVTDEGIWAAVAMLDVSEVGL